MYNTNEKDIKSLNCQTTKNKTNQLPVVYINIFEKKFLLHSAELCS